MYLAYCLLKFMSTLAGKDTYVGHLKPLAASVCPVLVMGLLNQRLQDLTDYLMSLGNLSHNSLYSDLPTLGLWTRFFSSFIDKGTNHITSIQMMSSTPPTVLWRIAGELHRSGTMFKVSEFNLYPQLKLFYSYRNFKYNFKQVWCHIFNHIPLMWYDTQKFQNCLPRHHKPSWNIIL